MRVLFFVVLKVSVTVMIQETAFLPYYALEHRYPKYGHKGRWCKAQTCELNAIIRQGIVTFEHEIHEASIKSRHDDHGED